ncbi:MAG: FadR family transcriptional regulator [Ruminococcus sp.]|nr:FadR family transcriptional regulator [Ruminococcus sp.]
MGRNSSQTPLYEQVVKIIEGQIMSGVYKKGDLLPSEKELIESLEVSRITVRKALSILADMGIIETSKGRGSTVIFNMEDTDSHEKFAEKIDEYRESFIESTQVRLLLEPEIAKQVAMEATSEQIEYLKQCLKGNVDKEMGLDFHRAIVSILNNKELNDIMNRLILAEEMNAPAGVIPPEKQDKIGKLIEGQHWRILEAIEKKDGEFAYFYMKEHTRFILQMYEEYFERLH